MTQREKVLTKLEQAGEDGVTTADFLADYMPRFSARIKELRDAGHLIATERISASSSRYTLRRSRGEERKHGGPETGSRVSGGSNSSGRAAANSGEQRGGGGSPPVTALPTLFEPEPLRPLRHYESEAV